MSTEPIAKYSIPGLVTTVYQNRIVISRGAWPMAKEEMITFRNIASIEKPALLNCLDIKTTDGKKHRITVSPFDTPKLKALIESLL